MIAVRNFIVLAIGVVLVGAGFVYLARGSITLAPLLLVAGYCVAIPVGVMLGASRDGQQSGSTRGEGANSSAG